MVRQRVRIRFSKSDRLRYIGHKDLLRALESLFRRARLPLAMSGGFHPKVRMSFPSALALGVEGVDEVLELEFKEPQETKIRSESVCDFTVDDHFVLESTDASTDALLRKLNEYTLPGLAFLSAEVLKDTEKKCRLESSVYEMIIPEELRGKTAKRVEEMQEMAEILQEKRNGKIVNIMESLSDITFCSETGSLKMRIASLSGPEAGFKEVLAAIGIGSELFRTIFPVRTECRINCP